MKKLIALLLVLCISAAALPAFAQSSEVPAPSGSVLGDLASGLLELIKGGDNQESSPLDKLSELIKQVDTDKVKNDLSGLIAKLKDSFSGLMKKLKDAASESGGKGVLARLKSKLKDGVSDLRAKLKDGTSESGGKVDLAGLKSKLRADLSKARANLGEKKDSLLSGLKEKLSADDSGILQALLDKIHGFADRDESSDDDKTIEQELAETFEKLNREAEAETGASIPNKKEATSVDQFYGNWKQTKFVIAGIEYDMSDSGEGAYFGENTYYTTSNGDKSEDYFYPETAELFIRDGVLKINCNGNWTTYVMTEDGQIVIPGGGLEIYFAREEE